MAVTATQKLDVERIRADFPYLEQLQDGKQVAFLDSAASTQKPRQVLDAMTQFYETSYANVHRGVYRLAERATEELEGAREKVRALLNAPSAREVIFVRNATEAINVVAYSWGLNELGPGDLVLVTELEHHSNFVPWQYIANRTGASLPDAPARRERRAPAGPARRGRRQRHRQGRRGRADLELAGDEQPGRAARGVGSRARRDRGRRRGAGGAAPHPRRADARLRLPRGLGPQDVRPERRRRALGSRRAARADGALPARRPHDPGRRRRGDDLGRAAAQVRGGHRADGRGGRVRSRDRLPERRRVRRDRAARAPARPRTRSTLSQSCPG